MWKKLVCLAVALSMILGGCAERGRPPEDGKEASPSASGTEGTSGAPPEQEAVSEELAQMLMADYAAPYEAYARGETFPEYGFGALTDASGFHKTEGVTSDFCLGWLAEIAPAGVASKRKGPPEDPGYRVDGTLIRTAARFFFDTEVESNSCYTYAGDAEVYAKRGAPVLSLKRAERIGNGDILLVISRQRPDGRPLDGALYRLRPFTVETPPEGLLGEVYKPGDTAYQFVAVTDLPRHGADAPKETVEITTVEGLLAMAAETNGDDPTCQNRRYLLMNDLDLAGVDWTPIGSYVTFDGGHDSKETGFNAEFDGQGHTIRNLKVEVPSPEEQYAPAYAGFFARIGYGGVVRNLNLENGQVRNTASSDGARAAGLLAGSCGGLVEHCSVQGTVAGSYQVGGFVGAAEGYDSANNWNARIVDCVSDVKVTGSAETGGFAGSMHGAILENCRAYGTVSAVAGESYERPNSIGGFAGFSVAADVRDSGCSVEVRTEAEADWVGAFMGYNQGGIYNCLYDLKKAPGWEAVDVIYQDSTSDVVGKDTAAVDALSSEGENADV